MDLLYLQALHHDHVFIDGEVYMVQRERGVFMASVGAYLGMREAHASRGMGEATHLSRKSPNESS